MSPFLGNQEYFFIHYNFDCSKELVLNTNVISFEDFLSFKLLFGIVNPKLNMSIHYIIFSQFYVLLICTTFDIIQIHYYKKYELLPYYWMLWKLPLDINETANPIVAFQPPFDKRSIHLIVCLGISLLWSSSCVYNIFCFPNHTLMDHNSNNCHSTVFISF